MKYEAHCIYDHLNGCQINLKEEIMKTERGLRKDEEIKVGHNFHDAYGHAYATADHAAESENEELARKADDFRALYQKLAKARDEMDLKRRISIMKSCITDIGKLLNFLMENFVGEEDE